MIDDINMQILFMDMLDNDDEPLTAQTLEDKVNRLIDNLRYAILDICEDNGIEDYYLPI